MICNPYLFESWALSRPAFELEKSSLIRSREHLQSSAPSFNNASGARVMKFVTRSPFVGVATTYSGNIVIIRNIFCCEEK